jgi:hypothetical protein
MPRIKLLVEERWNAVTPRERLAWIMYGRNAASWESPPDYAERVLKFDPRISLSGGHALSAIFRAAYNELAKP